VAAIFLGPLEQGASIPLNLGKLSLVAAVLGVPIRALVVQCWPEKAFMATSQRDR